MILPTSPWSDDLDVITQNNDGFHENGKDRFGTVTRVVDGRQQTTLYRHFVRSIGRISSIDHITDQILYGDPARPGFKVEAQGDAYLVTVHVKLDNGKVFGGSRLAIPRN